MAEESVEGLAEDSVVRPAEERTPGEMVVIPATREQEGAV